MDKSIYIARILYPVKVLGPGERIGIWFDGCEHKCKGCSNPELWDFRNKYLTNIPNVIRIIKSITDKRKIDGFTITGGDPFYQADALNDLLTELQSIHTDILVYTGYQYEELIDKYQGVISKVAVLIDGKYEEDKNDGSILRGSNNQRIFFIQSAFEEKYANLLNHGVNEIQNFYSGKSIVSVGIHKKNYEEDFVKKIKEKGLIEDE
jgi:anaerobic ribonucleoside-triphosphate reductase activating protein